jgi:hypothetical protein
VTLSSCMIWIHVQKNFHPKNFFGRIFGHLKYPVTREWNIRDRNTFFSPNNMKLRIPSFGSIWPQNIICHNLRNHGKKLLRPKLPLETKFFSTAVEQGCQMVSFQTKNPDFGKFWRALNWKMLIYFMALWNILQTFSIFYEH